MCKKLKWFLCTVCESNESKLDPCIVDDDVICDECFERIAIEDKDELSLLIVELVKNEPNYKPPVRKAK